MLCNANCLHSSQSDSKPKHVEELNLNVIAIWSIMVGCAMLLSKWPWEKNYAQKQSLHSLEASISNAVCRIVRVHRMSPFLPQQELSYSQ